MSSPDWSSLFDEVHAQPGASDAEILGLIEAVKQPLSVVELEQIKVKHRHLAEMIARLAAKHGGSGFTLKEPAKWKLPRKALPQTYLDFLRWSNGGSFRKGAKWFDPVFRTDEVRSFLLGYDLPQYLPGVLPFAFDGSGTFYVLDLRRPPQVGEYPVRIAHASNLCFRASRQIGATFLDACRLTDDPMDLL